MVARAVAITTGQARGADCGDGDEVIKLLLVEDNEMSSDMLKRRLVRRGYDVALAMDGMAAVELVAAEHPDIVLMDIGLPVMDGYEAMRHIRAMPEHATTPIIALTAHVMTEDRDMCMAAGASDYDTKPVNFQRLLDKLEAQLRRSGKGPPDQR